MRSFMNNKKNADNSRVASAVLIYALGGGVLFLSFGSARQAPEVAGGGALGVLPPALTG
jgi:hypothetical protein